MTDEPDARKPGPALLTPAELALHWRISTRTLDRWRRERYGPGWVALGGRILYRRSDVEAYEIGHLRNGSRGSA